MNITRRGFLGLILASGIAPALVRAESLMILPQRRLLVVRRIGWGAGVAWVEYDDGTIEPLKSWSTPGQFHIEYPG